MQGRLSAIVGGRIQAFPWHSWKEEFETARRSGFELMEWTIDQNRLYENPLLTANGQVDIRALSLRYSIGLPSVTGDCFMQAPFWKAPSGEDASLKEDFLAVTRACADLGISIIVVPLVDNGRLDNTEHEDALVSFLEAQTGFLASLDLRIAFESDFDPAELNRFIDRLDPLIFGINYDMGNSAALGFDPTLEMATYGHRIFNVHVKDRVLGGTTVPLGTGDTDFETAFHVLGGVGYDGNYVLQTARAENGDHSEVLIRYREMTLDWLTRHGA